MKEDIIVLGRGGHAKVVIDMIEEDSRFNIIGVTDSNIENDNFFEGYPLLGNDDVLQDYYNKGIKNIVLGIGGFIDNNLRRKLYEKVVAIGFNLPPIIHSSAVISKTAIIGQGTVIKRGAIIDTKVQIGVNNVVEIGAIVGHESIVGDHVLLSANVMISAYNNVGDDAFFAVASTIVSGINVCQGALIGAGAVVVKDINKKGTYIGIPAKLKKE